MRWKRKENIHVRNKRLIPMCKLQMEVHTESLERAETGTLL